MIRRPNKVTERAPLDLVMEFLPHEFAVLKHNPPGPTGKKGGGMQGMESFWWRTPIAPRCASGSTRSTTTDCNTTS